MHNLPIAPTQHADVHLPSLPSPRRPPLVGCPWFVCSCRCHTLLRSRHRRPTIFYPICQHIVFFSIRANCLNMPLAASNHHPSPCGHHPLSSDSLPTAWYASSSYFEEGNFLYSYFGFKIKLKKIFLGFLYSRGIKKNRCGIDHRSVLNIKSNLKIIYLFKSNYFLY